MSVWTYPPARFDNLSTALPKSHKGTMWEGGWSVDDYVEFSKQ
jgi:hypothetical protein